MSTEWYYTSGGQQQGPVSAAQIKQLAGSGAIGPEDMLWNQSMPDWVPAKRVKGLNFAGAQAAPAAAPRAVATAPAVAPAPVAAHEEPAAPEAWPEEPAPAQQWPAQASNPLQYEAPGREGNVSERAVSMLAQTRPWVLLVCVLAFIASGFLVLAGLAGFALSAIGGARALGVSMVMGLFYLATSAMYFIPAMFLARYAARINDVKRMGRSMDLEAALEAQKSFWKFTGILILVAIGLYFLLIVILVAIGATAALR